MRESERALEVRRRREASLEPTPLKTAPDMGVGPNDGQLTLLTLDPDETSKEHVEHWGAERRDAPQVEDDLGPTGVERGDDPLFCVKRRREIATAVEGQDLRVIADPVGRE